MEFSEHHSSDNNIHYIEPFPAALHHWRLEEEEEEETEEMERLKEKQRRMEEEKNKKVQPPKN